MVSNALSQSNSITPNGSPVMSAFPNILLITNIALLVLLHFLNPYCVFVARDLGPCASLCCSICVSMLYPVFSNEIGL